MRQKRARVHRMSDQRLLHPSRWTKSSGRRGKPSGSNTRASRDRPPPSRPSEGREREEGKTRGARLPENSLRKDIGAVEEEPEGQKKFAQATEANTSTATKANQNICHNLILSSKPIATPTKRGEGNPWPVGVTNPRTYVKKKLWHS